MTEIDHGLAVRLKNIYNALHGKAVVVSSEAALGTLVRNLLTDASLKVEAEVQIGEGNKDRIDFLVDRIGIELKTKGSWAEVFRQLERYALSDKLDAVVLVTTKRRVASAARGHSLNGKPVVAICIGAF